MPDPLDDVPQAELLDVTEMAAEIDRVHALLDAVMAIGSALDLQTVLHRITESAARLAGAEYGALGVIGEGGVLVQFLTVGIDAETHALIGALPRGKGLLGHIVDSGEVLRLDDLTAHVSSYGFPANHPPMRSFLGVPVRVRDEVFGNLYLTEKKGGKPFDEADERVVAALATAAGVMIENARLYAEAKRREDWERGAAEVTTALLSGAEPDEVFELIARRACQLLEADAATVFMPAGDELVVEVAVGLSADALRGVRVPLKGSIAGDVFTSGRPVIIESISEDPRVSAQGTRQTYGPALLVPLVEGGVVRGLLTAANLVGGRRFGPPALALLEVFAGQAAVALELAHTRKDAERLVVHHDRDRIARDLHDLVIQRLFAIGMRLESVAPLITQSTAVDAVHLAVDDLDTTIRDIRSTIYALQSAHPGGGGASASLRARVLSTTEELTPALGTTPSVRFDGLVDTRVSASVADDVVAVLREALSNVARHAGAHSVTVSVEAGLNDLVLEVRDDGIGFSGSPERRSGLANISSRAESDGGVCEVSSTPGAGTCVTWRVPLRG